MKKLNLNNLFSQEINERDLSNLKGGEQNNNSSQQLRCTCGCHYENNGGSNSCDNSTANFKLGLHSIGGGYGCQENELNYQNFWINCI